MCSDGKRDGANEECDDGNTSNGDGCSSTCVIEDGWKCLGGTVSTIDVCYKNPIASISSVSSSNEIQVKFTEQMKIFNPSGSEYVLSISGPLSPYSFSSFAKFIDSNTLFINLTISSQMKGENNEILSIQFDKSKFISINNIPLYNSNLNTTLNKVTYISSEISSAGSGVNAVMTTTIVAVISSNVMFQQSSDLLWGFLSTIQIIYYFPLLSLYFPDNLSAIITYLSSSRLKLSISQVESLKSNLKSEYQISDNIGMPALNSQYESLDYNSTSFLINGEDLFSTLLQGLLVCVVVYGIRACLFTLRANENIYDNDLNEFQTQNNQKPSKNQSKVNKRDVKQNKIIKNAKNLETQDNQILEDLEEIERMQNTNLKEIRLKRWFKRKIKELSYEYKFNFFLRVGNQIYLESSILALLNIRYCVFQNIWQILSFILSIFSIFLLIAYLIWVTKEGCRNYIRFRNKVKVDIPEYESLFGEYKTQNMPQFLFNTYFMLRRLLYACIIIFLVDFPQLQAFFFLIICLPVLAYHLVMNPYRTVPTNFIMNLNELSFVVIGSIFFAFIEPTSDSQRKNILGWIVIAIILSVTMINISVIWVLKILLIRKELSDWWKAYKLKRSIDKEKQQKEEVTEKITFESGRFVRVKNLENPQNTISNPTASDMHSLCSDLPISSMIKTSQFLRVNIEDQHRFSFRRKLEEDKS